MTSRYNVRLGSNWLHRIDDRILVLDVAYSQPERNISQMTTANLGGYEIDVQTYSRQTVTVTFELHIYDTAERNAVCQKVNEWAQAGGYFRSSDREGQYLSVVCDQYAVINSAKNWTDPLTLVFVTHRNPFWRSDNIITKAVSGKNGTGKLKMDGNIDSALVSCEVTGLTAGEKINRLTVTVGATSLILTGLDIAYGKSVVIDYLAGRYLRIKGAGKSILNRLDPSSSDNLLAPCGATSDLNAKSNTRVQATFTARGCWI